MRSRDYWNRVGRFFLPMFGFMFLAGFIPLALLFTWVGMGRWFIGPGFVMIVAFSLLAAMVKAPAFRRRRLAVDLSKLVPDQPIFGGTSQRRTPRDELLSLIEPTPPPKKLRKDVRPDGSVSYGSSRMMMNSFDVAFTDRFATITGPVAVLEKLRATIPGAKPADLTIADVQERVGGPVVGAGIFRIDEPRTKLQRTVLWGLGSVIALLVIALVLWVIVGAYQALDEGRPFRARYISAVIVTPLFVLFLGVIALFYGTQGILSALSRVLHRDVRLMPPIGALAITPDGLHLFDLSGLSGDSWGTELHGRAAVWKRSDIRVIESDDARLILDVPRDERTITFEAAEDIGAEGSSREVIRLLAPPEVRPDRGG